VPRTKAWKATLKLNRFALVVRVAQLILQYLDEHPHAKDTAQGIANWWVFSPEDLVEDALQLLMATQLVTQKEFAVTGKVYMATSFQPEEARHWLSSMGATDNRG
jgi:hypothetical protein